jgi:hypothetical protein
VFHVDHQHGGDGRSQDEQDLEDEAEPVVAQHTSPYRDRNRGPGKDQGQRENGE